MTILVLDLARVLDESAFGRSAQEALTRELDEARLKHEGMRQQAKSAAGPTQTKLVDEARAFERDTLAGLEKKRAELRETLLNDVRAIVDEIRTARKSTLVLDARAVVMAAEADDITAEVLARVDAKGPQRRP
jgi:Skp family chaperone for outer membrane proteins